MTVLFTPAKIGAIDLKNRFVRSATVECLTSKDNRLTEQYYRLYKRLAKGGVGLIIPGNYFINAIGRAADKVLVIDEDGVIDDLKRLTDMVHCNGAKIVGQINHCGGQGNPKLIGDQPIGPSGGLNNGTNPREMSFKEIEETIIAYGNAAGRIKKAGFDGVQINGAHGYLVNQFLSSSTNRRKDQWGGSIQNRMRFVTRVYESIRDQVGGAYPILIKINGEDQVKGGITIEETIPICRKLEALGLNALEVSGGTYDAGFATTKGDIPAELIGLFNDDQRKASAFTEGYFLQQASQIRKHVSIPVIAVGGMRRREKMEKALLEGHADFIALSRPFIRQPAFVRQMEKSPDADPISCTNCNRCTVEITLKYNPLRCYYSPKESTKDINQRRKQ